MSVSCTKASGATFAIGNANGQLLRDRRARQQGHRQLHGDGRRHHRSDAQALTATRPPRRPARAGAVVNYTATANDAVDGTVPVTCTPSSGSVFPLGATTVNCSAADVAGNSGSDAFTVTVVDTTAPQIAAVPAAVSAEATGPAGATVTYPSPTATDLVDGGVAVDLRPALGQRPRARADRGDLLGDRRRRQHRHCRLHGHRRGHHRAVIAAHEDVTAEATGPAGATVSYGAPATSDAVDGPGSAACAPASGSVFALGATTVTCAATDAAGNKAEATTFAVTVVDTTAPELALPKDITEAQGSNGSTVNFTGTAQDAVDGPVASHLRPGVRQHLRRGRHQGELRGDRRGRQQGLRLLHGHRRRHHRSGDHDRRWPGERWQLLLRFGPGRTDVHCHRTSSPARSPAR